MKRQGLGCSTWKGVICDGRGSAPSDLGRSCRAHQKAPAFPEEGLHLKLTAASTVTKGNSKVSVGCSPLGSLRMLMLGYT